MKIVQLIQRPQARGAEIFTSQLSTQLEILGHSVLLISLFKGDFGLPFSGSQIHLNLNSKNRLWNFSAWKKLGKIIREFNPDIVQANGADTLKFSVFARILVPGKYRLIFNNGGVVSYYVHSRIKRKFNQFLFSKVDGLISVSNYSKQDLDAFFSVSKPHHVIPIGIELGPKSNFEGESKDQIFVHIAGFTPEKNQKGAIEIFENLLIYQANSQLWFIGDGPLKKEIEAEVKTKSFSNQVRFMGAIQNPFSQIPSNSISILPSKIEGLPAVILEAFYHRIPVVAYAVGGISDVIVDKVTGMLVAPNDKEVFVSSVLEYLNYSEIEKERIINNAQRIVNENYQIEAVAFQFENFYQSL